MSRLAGTVLFLFFRKVECPIITDFNWWEKLHLARRFCYYLCCVFSTLLSRITHTHNVTMQRLLFLLKGSGLFRHVDCSVTSIYIRFRQSSSNETKITLSDQFTNICTCAALSLFSTLLFRWNEMDFLKENWFTMPGVQ